MSTSKIGIIGGSGVYNLESVKIIQRFEMETPFGKPSSAVLLLALQSGEEFYFLTRHGEGHFINPSEINYRANIYALKTLGVETVVSVSAVGSLKEEHNPTKFVLVDQFIDFTKGLRKRSFFDSGMVGHVSCANPIELNLQKRIASVCAEEKLHFSVGGTYLCIEGPQFSTKAESNIYRSLGADVIGMTNVPEAYLAKEAGMAYATVAMITDYDCWKEVHCTVDEIMKVMKDNYISTQKLISSLIPSLVKEPIKFQKENSFAVITNRGLLSNEQKEIMEVLFK